MTNMLTTVEAAAYAGCTVSTIRSWIRKGYLGEDLQKQNISRGNGCGYRINEDILMKLLHC